jgi:NodT family efflux transporter outer membrane factor (OMF) lipoprotein
MVRRVVAMAGMFALAGCAGGHLPAPQVAVPSRFEAASTGAVPAQALDHWWLLFGDAQLTALIDQGLASAPDARSALARLREAEATRRGALTPYDPQGNPTASISRSDTTLTGVPVGVGQTAQAGQVTTLSGAFNVSWELDLFGRRDTARGAADADLAAARFNFEATRFSLSATIASQLFGARGLSAQVVEAEEALRIAQELARIGQLRMTSGLGSASDAARLDSQLATARSDLANLRARLTVARRTLLVLLGRGTETLDTLAIEPVLPTPPRPPQLTPAEVMVRRPDVREAEQRLVSAARTLRLDQLALFPRLTLQPGASYTRVIDPATFTQSVWSLAAGLLVPVLDRPRLLARIGAQTARGEQAVIAYERSVQSAYGDAENSLTTLSSDLDRLAFLEQAEQHARFAFSAQQQGYRAGIVTLDTLLQTEQAWRAARIALLTLKTSTLVDAVTSFKALGGGWTPDPVNGN